MLSATVVIGALRVNIFIEPKKAKTGKHSRTVASASDKTSKQQYCQMIMYRSLYATNRKTNVQHVGDAWVSITSLNLWIAQRFSTYSRYLLEDGRAG